MNTFSDPRTIVEQLPIFAGQKVADFGSGSGAYSLLLAQKVGGTQSGAVYSIDVQQNLVEQLVSQAREQNLTCIHPVWGDLEAPQGSRLRDNSIQLVLIANTLFQAEHPARLIREAQRVLVPDGLLVIVDWSESFGNIGPKEDHVITQEAAKLMVEENNFEIEKPIEAGEHHYGIIARKKMN
jgi:ubiquinone/menaquinone biosynthesis C-methylase UbiE